MNKKKIASSQFGFQIFMACDGLMALVKLLRFRHTDEITQMLQDFYSIVDKSEAELVVSTIVSNNANIDISDRLKKFQDNDDGFFLFFLPSFHSFSQKISKNKTDDGFFLPIFLLIF